MNVLLKELHTGILVFDKLVFGFFIFDRKLAERKSRSEKHLTNSLSRW